MRLNKSDPSVDYLSFDIRDGNNQKVKKLLKEVGIDACDSYLRTPLIYASLYNTVDLLTWLIDNGANVNHQDKNGYAALHFIGKEKQFETGEILIKNKADLELKDRNGNTPIMDAIFNSKGDYKVVNLLIKAGANIDNKNNHEMTPRLLAESMEGFEYSLPPEK